MNKFEQVCSGHMGTAAVNKQTDRQTQKTEKITFRQLRRCVIIIMRAHVSLESQQMIRGFLNDMLLKNYVLFVKAHRGLRGGLPGARASRGGTSATTAAWFRILRRQTRSTSERVDSQRIIIIVITYQRTIRPISLGIRNVFEFFRNLATKASKHFPAAKKVTSSRI